MAVSDFQRTLMNLLSRQRMSVANLAEHTDYNPLLVENLIAGKSREITGGFLCTSCRYARPHHSRERRIGGLMGIRDREAELACVIAPDSEPRESTVTASNGAAKGYGTRGYARRENWATVVAQNI